MSPGFTIPQNYLIDIINPENAKGPKIKAVIPHRVYQHFYKKYPVKYQNLVAAKYVLENPQRIFSGVDSLTREDGALQESQHRGTLGKVCGFLSQNT